MIFIKRYGNIYPIIYNLSNLKKAYKKARQSIDKNNKNKIKELKYFENNKEKLLLKLQKDLKTKNFTTSDYNIFKIEDRGKTREIYDLPFYPDRIVHWAIMLQTQDIFMKTFIYDSYAAIPNKGSHLCLKRMRKEMINNKEKCKYTLKLDIKKYFPNINQGILSRMMRKKFKDENLLWLLDDIIYSTNSGLPIGNYTSQFFGNFYLTYFDHYCKEELKLKRYYRYMDDIVIMHQSKEFLHKIKIKINKYLKNKLKVWMKDNWQAFPTFVRGIDFVGYRNFGKYVLLRKSTLKRMKRKLTGYLKFAKENGYITHSMWCSFNSYKGWIKWCNSYNLYNKYFKPLESYSNKYYKEMIT